MPSEGVETAALPAQGLPFGALGMAPGADIARVEQRAGGALQPAARGLGIAGLAVFETGHQPAQPPRRAGPRRGRDPTPEVTPPFPPHPSPHSPPPHPDLPFRP